MSRARKRSMAHRWASLHKLEAEHADFMERCREPLRLALARIYRDDLLALHWLRSLLIHYHFYFTNPCLSY